MKSSLKKVSALLLAVCLCAGTALPAFAAVSYMPDVTAEMSDADYWAGLCPDPDRVWMTAEEIAARNAQTAAAVGTMVVDLKSAALTFDGIARREALNASSTADAQYYFGWTYGSDGNPTSWSSFQTMIDNCADPDARRDQPVRFGIAVDRTLLQVFPSSEPIWDDPADPDFDYQALSGIRVNEPVLIYATSADGRYYQVQTSCCSGWTAAEHIAVCADRNEWLRAWDIPEDELLVVYGNKVYTDASNSHPETARRMLTLATRLRSVDPAQADSLIGNRSPYHNYIVELPVRNADGSYRCALALIPETAKVSEGFLPLTQRNIAMVALGSLGDAYGWGGMMEVEDCSSLVRLIYECFGLDMPRNGNWQWNMQVPRIDMADMSLEEKCLLLDTLPLGTALCFNGHEMLYLGCCGGKYYVFSSVSSMMDPGDASRRLRVRDVLINTLDVRRANGRTWLQEINQAILPGFDEGALPAPAWYHDGVAFCLKNEVMALEPDGSFALNRQVTRADAAQSLWRLAGAPAAEGELAFTDVASEAPEASAVLWAAQTGIMIGRGDGRFCPDEPLTREQLAVILLRFAADRGADVRVSAELTAYRDGVAVSEYAEEAMSWACGAGLINGTATGLLEPAGFCTRAQLAVILGRFSERVSTGA